MNRIIIAAIACASIWCSGCSAFRALVPGGTQPQDAEWTAEVSGPSISIAASLDERGAALVAVLTALGQADPLGVVLPVTVAGSPRLIICSGDFTARCSTAQKGEEVRFAGSPIGSGLSPLWQPSRLVIKDLKVRDVTALLANLLPANLLPADARRPPILPAYATASNFNEGMLWPVSSYHDMHPSALRSVAAQFGPGLDAGALRLQGTDWYVLMSSTPTTINPSNNAWVRLDLNNASQIDAANQFRRYGVGWSFGPWHNRHDDASGLYQIVHGRNPGVMEKLDLDHSKMLFRALEAQAKVIMGGGGDSGDGDSDKPPLPPVLPLPTPPKGDDLAEVKQALRTAIDALTKALAGLTNLERQ